MDIKTDMDLQEKTRMQDVYNDIEDIIDKISKLPVGQPLVWVYVWDVARQLWKDIMEGHEEEYCTGMDEEEMWELFWTQADQNGFTLEFGTASWGTRTFHTCSGRSTTQCRGRR